MVINNLHKIIDLLEFDEIDKSKGGEQKKIDKFYHLQIIKRKKENPELGSNSMTITTHTIDSREKLIDMMPMIRNICDATNSRAYINPNPKSYIKAFQEVNHLLSLHLKNGNYKSARGAYDSVVGKKETTCSKAQKIWVIDCDDFTTKEVMDVCVDIYNIRPNGKKVLEILETAHGYHILSKPFDVSSFEHEKLKTTDIQKNNPTLLYFNSDLSK